MSLADLFTAHSATLLRFLSRYADPELCEEIASRTWCKIASQGLPAKSKADTPDIQLVCTMAKGLLSDYRKRCRRADTVPGEVWEFVPGQFDIDTSRELLETLPSDLRSLAESIQAGHSVTEWAESQGIAISTAYARLKQLQSLLA